MDSSNYNEEPRKSRVTIRKFNVTPQSAQPQQPHAPFSSLIPSKTTQSLKLKTRPLTPSQYSVPKRLKARENPERNTVTPSTLATDNRRTVLRPSTSENRFFNNASLNDTRTTMRTRIETRPNETSPFFGFSRPDALASV